jgi:putative FmdB family regulatory protein
MPIYGYRCGDCGHQFEIQQKMSDASLTVCPNCQGKLRKVIYPTGIIYKGSGYYTTDYKGAGKGAAPANGSSATTEAKSETKSESTKSESSSEPKSESTKPESKPESKDSKSEKSSQMEKHS